MDKRISLILKEASKISLKRNRVSYLKANASEPLRVILRFNFDTSLTWDLPKGIPPHRKPIEADERMASIFFVESRKLFRFLKGGMPAAVARSKRESLFISVIEQLHPEDALMVCAAKDRELEKLYPGVSEIVVRKAFPKLMPPPKEPLVDDEEEAV